MQKKEFYFKSADGETNIHAVEWKPDGEVVGILQIAHGVTEYILRYENFAKYLTDRGFLVVGNDLLGHGTSIKKNGEPMYFGPKGSWDFVVDDLNTCKKMVEEEFPNVPYCLLGFSLGSFLVRTYLIEHPNNVDATILLGTGQMSLGQIAIAKFIATNEARKVGEEHTSPMIKKLTFETYNKIFAPNRTDFDWLCSSNKNLDIYIKDPLRGGNLSAGLFREMLSGMAYTFKKKNLQKMNINIPILLVSGDKDPVGDCGKGVEKTYNTFKKVGIKDVTMKLYPGLRHDILNEDCKDEIYEYLYQWLDNKLLKKDK